MRCRDRRMKQPADQTGSNTSDAAFFSSPPNLLEDRPFARGRIVVSGAQTTRHRTSSTRLAAQNLATREARRITPAPPIPVKVDDALVWFAPRIYACVRLFTFQTGGSNWPKHRSHKSNFNTSIGPTAST